MSDFPIVTVEGDPDGGWIVGIHDGDQFKTHHPVAATAEEARAIAWQEHFGSPEHAPTEPEQPAA